MNVVPMKRKIIVRKAEDASKSKFRPGVDFPRAPGLLRVCAMEVERKVVFFIPACVLSASPPGVLEPRS